MTEIENGSQYCGDWPRGRKTEDQIHIASKSFRSEKYNHRSTRSIWYGQAAIVALSEAMNMERVRIDLRGCSEKRVSKRTL
jgi:hypothetical protein